MEFPGVGRLAKIETLSKMTQIGACFMQNFMELHVRKCLYPKVVIFGGWGLKTSIGQLGPKYKSSYKSGT